MICTIDFKRLPFKPVEQEIIYTEGQYNPIINDFIRRNYENLRKIAGKRLAYFRYIPFMEDSYLLNNEIKDYYAPYIGKKAKKKTLGSDLILKYLANPSEKDSIPPMLLFYREPEKNSGSTAKYQYRGSIINIPLNLSEMNSEQIDTSLLKSFSDAISKIYWTPIMECMVYHSINVGEIYEPPSADDLFDEESKRLLLEIKERVDKLEQKGIGKEVLKNILYGSTKLSRLIITKDRRITLPDYNLDIKLPALPKAVYFLFLKHPEGIFFKCLPEYRDELSTIYEELRHGPLSEREQQSVDDVVDPLNNSINEKCARIREAFISKFDEHLAKRYCINGRRGERKRISLPQKLITWE